MNGCPLCGSRNVSITMTEERFPYGVEGDQTMLTAKLPVMLCRDCNQSWTDHEGEAARSEALCQHLQHEVKRLTEKVRGYEAWERSVNDALNSGDGAYRP